MSIKSDKWVKSQPNLITPFESQLISKGISYGLSSYGYDLRCSEHFKIFTPRETDIIDPLRADEIPYVDYRGEVCEIPPFGFVLACTIEYIKMPRDVSGIILNKSTYARANIDVRTTVIEAGWEGQITLEIANGNPCPARIYANQGIAQLIFIGGDGECEISYADRKGKYMWQIGPTMGR